MENKDPSRTEEPTEKRIKKSREDDGNVLRSEDVNSVVLILVGTLVMALLTVPATVDAYRYIFDTVLAIDCSRDWTDSEYALAAGNGGYILAGIILPAMFAFCLTAYAVNRIQVGKYFSAKPLRWKAESLKPDLKSILPNQKNAVNLALAILKVFIIALAVYVALRGDYQTLLGLPLISFHDAVRWIMRRALYMILQVVSMMVVIAIIDYWYKRMKYYSDLKMTKDEVKDERKATEGDPKVKMEIRKRMMQMLMSIIREVPKADVVVTNPTHVAVALRYEPGDPAPKVVAKGLRKRALRIKKIALDHGVPVVENKPLARGLYRNTKVGQFIPPQFFGAVAAVLAQLHRAGLRRFNLA